MISSNKIRTNANHRLKIKSTQLLKYAVVYGANASGKTNLALFFKFFKDSVCNGIPIEATQMFCKNRWHCSLNFLKIVSAMVFR